MRSLVLGLTLMFLAGCCNGARKSDTAATVAANARVPASTSSGACNVNNFEGGFVDNLRREIAAKYGEDFGARCTELTDAFTHKGEGCGQYRKEICKGKDAVLCQKFEGGYIDSLRLKITAKYGQDHGVRCTEWYTKFTYSTEGCANYRQEACVKATEAWIQQKGGVRGGAGAEAGT